VILVEVVVILAVAPGDVVAVQRAGNRPRRAK